MLASRLPPSLDRHLVILRCGDPAAPVLERRGPFSSWIAAPMRSAWDGEMVEIDVRETTPEKPLLRAAGIVLTGSSHSVTERAPWMKATERLLAEAVERDVPVLGICFGHQILAQALGGTVEKNPRGREIGTIEIAVTGADPLFKGLGPTFSVNATHVDTVVARPPGATVFASSSLEPTAAFAVGSARGVQFHPEFDGDIMRGYLDARRELLVGEGFDVDAMIAAATDAPAGAAILVNFVEYLARR
jgi:GMP synthase (glutamine-hydrolysing)